ncbi:MULTISPECIES: nucleoside triphosphate pyrophosphohydrolase family protein [Latilactobacillus]|jgi:NTP pyrophosphatase (non-canonical NTP hydrolase)|uniref:Nucleoside triphosphate pyrophosphohydrolase family protein n=2 Tax=Latilactobacillus curvatus TaxID=28038 RepID=A0A0B2XGM9_LATCU|nr:nucleoside triphosphate pyrophosphohydrolase family protein [Latilactobacillus curvatus]MDT3393318.1 nucleoside triphosphate pyrophosphohydrolase family protein [Bacillota bacterium]ANJ69249.1 nucleotide pyrophosphohydrolase [Latilactobacillus curvatus]ANY13960.1 nucleotide pyrophosphohydrolase [Latilactobacillus curvatus]AOO75612.1 nucleotide pyrophosphohydrolase [Latilactobacillus curvatus]ASN60265.1 nucleotide pyrophosphohydrolase [Latilactobacillus curvatus]
MEFNDYQKLANRTLYGNEQVLTNLALGLASESGEVVDIVKKYAFQGHELDEKMMSKKIGDVLWYLSQIAEWNNLDFDKVARENIEQLKQRYPERHAE